MDCCFSDLNTCKLLLDNLGRISYRFVTSLSIGTLKSAFSLGLLYLSYFSGPVEGILIIISVFAISGYFG